MSYVWLRDPADSRDPRIEWVPETNPYRVPAGYVHRDAVFRDHNCPRCHSGERPCVHGAANRCSWLHARND